LLDLGRHRHRHRQRRFAFAPEARSRRLSLRGLRRERRRTLWDDAVDFAFVLSTLGVSDPNVTLGSSYSPGMMANRWKIVWFAINCARLTI
jgi:hypothetical protein